MYNLTPALGLRLEDPLCEESEAIEKLFEDVPRRDRVFLDAVFEHKVDQAVSEPGVLAPFCGQKGEKEITPYVIPQRSKESSRMMR